MLVGTGGAKGKIEQLARQRGVLGSNLTITGAIPKHEVPVLLNVATLATSIFAPVPAMSRNSANKFFDALAAGKPIAINYQGWQAELLRQSGAGLVLPQDPKAAAKTLADFLRNPLRIEVATAAARTLRSEFDRDLLAAKLLSLLCATVDAHQGRKSSSGSYSTTTSTRDNTHNSTLH